MWMKPDLCETAQFLTLNLVASFLSSASHNALHFLLGLTTWHIHFLHYFVTFLVLLLARSVGLLSQTILPFKQFYPIALSQFCVTFCTAICHSLERDGSLYLLRLQDFAVTLLIICLAPRVFPAHLPKPQLSLPLILIAVGASLSWLEFGILEYNIWGLLATPFNIAAQATHIMVTFTTYDKLGCDQDLFLLHVTGITSLGLFLPAFCLFTKDGFQIYEAVSQKTSWESIDYTLLGLSVVFMWGLVVSKYWLMTRLPTEHYLVFRHVKYSMASVGQWFTQNMAHATIYSSCGKVLVFAATLCYFTDRFINSKARVKVKHANDAHVPDYK